MKLLICSELLKGKNGDTDVENGLVDTVGKVWAEWRKQHGHRYSTTCKIDGW